MKRAAKDLFVGLLVVAVGFTFVLSPFLSNAQAADPTVVFAVQPNSIQIDPGQSFNLTVVIASGGVNVSFGLFHIIYSQSLFSISSFKPASSWTVTQTNATIFDFTKSGSGSFTSGPIVELQFTPLTSASFPSARIDLQSPEARTFSGSPRVAVVHEKDGYATVSIKEAGGIQLWMAIVPVIAGLVPVVVHYLRKKKPTDQDKDDDKKRKKNTYTTSVLRKEDLLSLQFDFHNFKLEKSVPPAKIVRINPAAPAYMSVTFQGQNIAERAYFEVNKNVKLPPGDKDANTGDTDAPIPPPVPAVIAGPSRLVFRLPQNVQTILYSLDDLLNWTNYDLNVVPVALSAVPLEIDLLQSPQIRPPGTEETSIEVPYRLILSPSHHGGWAHSTKPVKHGPWTELWHTRLGVRKRVGPIWIVDEKDENERIVRAVWSPDYSASSPPNTNNKGPFRSSMTPRDRHEVVRLTSDLSIKDPFLDPSAMQFFQQGSAGAMAGKITGLSTDQGPAKVVSKGTSESTPMAVEKVGMQPQTASSAPAATAQFGGGLMKAANGRPPVKINRLMLSTLGAWIDSRGAWEPPNDLSVMEWVHRGTQGRDHYVKVVYKGYLFPLGHRASLVKVTERKFMRAPAAFDTPGNSPFIAYMRQRMYIVVLEHDKEYKSEGRNNQARDWPFTKVRVTTELTPNIDIPEQSGVKSLGIKAFWPRVNKNDFKFHMVADDVVGQRTEFDAPLVFVMNEIAHDPGLLSDVFDQYPKEHARREVDMMGQKVAFADSLKVGDTVLETSAIHLGCEKPITSPPTKDPYFFPVLMQFDVNIPSLAAVLGRAAEIQLSYDATFLGHGWDQSHNKGEVFAGIVPGSDLKMDFPGDKAGGLANPNMSVSGLSRSQGAVGGDVESIKQGTFDPSKYFKGAMSEAKILGISLLDVIATTGLDQVPKYVTEDTGKQIRSTMTWLPTVKNSTGDIFMAQIDRNGTVEKASLKITVTIVRDKSGSSSQSEVLGELKNFEIHLFPAVMDFLAIKFDRLAFEAKAGQKNNFEADINGIVFAGPLSFINELQKFIPLNGFDPPSLEVTPQGVKAGFDLGIPSIGFGVFTLQNINLGASLSLPFTGDPIRLRFAFCERQRPFLLSVAIFGGGGFFAVALGPDGIEIIEGSLEFGGNVSINIGVASGGIYVMAGIYFKIETTPQGEKLQLTGYLRCGGALEVLGLICISVEFYMGINYQPSPKRVWGEASLTVEVEVAFFSKSVQLTVEREFASSPPPSFEDVVPKLEDWSEYCGAFA